MCKLKVTSLWKLKEDGLFVLVAVFLNAGLNHILYTFFFSLTYFHTPIGANKMVGFQWSEVFSL